MTQEEAQKRAMVQAQITDLFANLDRELLLLMGGLAPGDELNAAAAAAGAKARRTAALINSLMEAEPCK
ncbi:hypothetical protein A1D30_05970 [Acidovorax sp. GW101-3H11]|uniref:hypothetical protein n=1 Tax=Acidovorax sp. GW101-3H11 TaxID=1813946 RepID=UPI0007B52E30|nr:hypothetical protein [Acidovorax sp. GW101-3H11]KZT17034.1 hypothetical protein A1D30_05970 [Acidovorax sp. GW101-3H11]